MVVDEAMVGCSLFSTALREGHAETRDVKLFCTDDFINGCDEKMLWPLCAATPNFHYMRKFWDNASTTLEGTKEGVCMAFAHVPGTDIFLYAWQRKAN